MRTFVTLVLVGWWLLQQPWTPFVVLGTIVLGAGLLAWTWVQHWQLQAAPQTWKRVEPHFEEPQPAEPPQDRLRLIRQIEQLEFDLKKVRQEATALRAAKERLKHDLKNAKAAEMRNRPNPAGKNGLPRPGAVRQAGGQQPVQLQGLAQVVGLAIGAPEFQRR